MRYIFAYRILSKLMELFAVVAANRISKERIKLNFFSFVIFYEKSSSRYEDFYFLGIVPIAREHDHVSIFPQSVALDT